MELSPQGRWIFLRARQSSARKPLYQPGNGKPKNRGKCERTMVRLGRPSPVYGVERGKDAHQIRVTCMCSLSYPYNAKAQVKDDLPNLGFCLWSG